MLPIYWIIFQLESLGSYLACTSYLFWIHSCENLEYVENAIQTDSSDPIKLLKLCGLGFNCGETLGEAKRLENFDAKFI
jgi:hypothetical protein